MKTKKKSTLPWWFVQLKLYHIVGDLQRQDYGSALATAIEIRGDVDRMELANRDNEKGSRDAVARQFFARKNCGKDPDTGEEGK